MLIMQALARVLLEMQALDADLAHLTVRQIDLHHAFAHDGILVLRDLITGRQVGKEVVLAVEHRAQVDLRIEAKPGAHRLLDAALVDHRQHAGHGGVDQRHLGVGIGAERGRGAGEQLGVRGNLRMHLHADDDLPRSRGAFDQLGVARSSHAHAGLHQLCGAALKSAAVSMARPARSTVASSKALPMS